MQFLSQLSNELGRRFQDRGWLKSANMAYSLATTLERRSASAWYNRGLMSKFERRWEESRDCNRRATELDPQNAPAWWNLGIAATALGDWTTARQAWKGFGLQVPDGDGPPDLQLGPVPIRVSPGSHPEVVWADRIDPARARITSVPLPDCQRGYGDLVLHDGEPRGQRIFQGREVSVFNELQVLEPGGFHTFGVQALFPTPKDYAELGTRADQAGAGLDDWSGIVPLCQQCSEGTPHEHEGPAPGPWVPDLQVGLATRSEPEARAILDGWLERGAGRSLIRFECVFSRT